MARYNITPYPGRAGYYPQQPQPHRDDTLGFDSALGYRIVQFSMESWTGWISGAIKRVDLREESPWQGIPLYRAKRCEGAAAMIPQRRPLIAIVAAIPDFR